MLKEKPVFRDDYQKLEAVSVEWEENFKEW